MGLGETTCFWKSFSAMRTASGRNVFSETRLQLSVGPASRAVASAGWSSLASWLPPMICFGLASSHTVERSCLPFQRVAAPLRTAYQQGSCCQW